MIALHVAALAALAALPSGAERYRFELGGEAIGIGELRVACEGARCRVGWSVRTRAPAEAGGAIHSRRVEVEVDPEGRWRDGPLSLQEDGVPVPSKGRWGAVPVSIAELVLARAREELGACVESFDERSGEGGRACARRTGLATWEIDVAGVAERVRMGGTGLPAEVAIPAQRVRWVADPRAEPPAAAPRLWGVEVAGAGEAEARRFCGVDRDPEPPRTGATRIPAPTAPGGSCREKTAAWLEVAARAGLPGRAAVGVAWDGRAFAWHEWAEVRVGSGWVPVDPSFGQLPARGPRFTLARFAPGDAAAAAAAGGRVLACWGRARVE